MSLRNRLPFFLAYAQKRVSKPTFLEYVEFDGNSYIDTGYKPNSNTAVNVEYFPHYNTVFACVFGTQDSATSNRFYGLVSSTLYRIQLNSGSINTFYGINAHGLSQGSNGTFTSLQQKVVLTIDNYNKQVKVESSELTNTFNMQTYNANLGAVNCQYSMLLGDRSTAGAPSANKFKGKIYGCKILEGDVLAQDLRPVLDPRGVVCFYDMVSKQYFYNQGTGTLKAGGRFVESILFDGESYIDTLITEKGGTWSVTASGDDSAQLRFLIGNGGSATQYFGTLANGYWGVGTQGEDPYFEIPRTEKITAQVVFEDYKITAVIDGVTKYKSGSTLSNNNFLLCGYSSVNYRFKGNVYHCSYTNTNGKLVLDLIPVKRSDGVVCMYDKVENKYYELKR